MLLSPNFTLASMPLSDNVCTCHQEHAVIEPDTSTDAVRSGAVHITTLSTMSNADNGTPKGDIGTVFRMQAVKAQVTQQLKASLAEFRRDDLVYRLPAPLSIMQPIIVLSGLQASAERIYVPRQRSLAVHKNSLTVTGGSGDYTWRVVDDHVVKITEKLNDNGGQSVSFSAVGKGATKVIITDTRLCYNTIAVEVHVVDIVEMHFVPIAIEIAAGETMVVPLRVTGQSQDGGKLTTFEACTSLPLTYTSDDESIFSIEGHSEVPTVVVLKDRRTNTPGNSGCTAVLVKANREGHTTLTAVYRDGSTMLTATLEIFAYFPLQVDSTNDEHQLVMGTTAHLRVSGGPLPWPLDQSKHVVDLIFDQDQELRGLEVVKDYHPIAVHRPGPNSSIQGFAWTLRCTALGTHDLQIVVGNQHAHMGFTTHVANVTTTVTCNLPSSLGQAPAFSAPQGLSIDTVPRHLQSDPQMAALAERCLGRTYMLTKTTNEFWIPVLAAGGEASPTEKADGVEGLYQFEYTSSDETIARVDTTNPERPTLVTLDKEGPVTITIRLTGVKDVDTSHQKLPTTSFSVHVVKPITASPRELHLYPNTTSKAFTLKHGSGIVHVYADDEAIARATLSNTGINSGTAEVLVQSAGKAGHTQVHATDVCFTPAQMKAATAMVTIHGIGKVEMRGCPSVAVQKPVFLYVKLLSDAGTPVGLHNMHVHERFTVHLDVGGSGLRLGADDPKVMTGEEELRFTLHGKAPGTYTVKAKVIAKGSSVVREAQYSVSVEAPLRFQMSERLFEGSEVPHALAGDRREHPSVHYHTSNEKVVAVSAKGVVSAVSAGVAQLTAVSEQKDPVSGAQCEISTAATTVTVVSLKSFGLVLPKFSVIKGARLPVHVMGSEGMTPMMFDRAGSLTFEWENESPDVLELRPRYHQAGVSLDNEGEISTEIYARGAGVGAIRVKMRHGNGRTAGEAVGYVHVVDPLTMKVASVPFPPTIVLPTNSVGEIITNKLLESCDVSVSAGAHVTHATKTKGSLIARTAAAEGESIVEVICTDDGTKNGDYQTVQRNAFPIDVRSVHFLLLVPASKAAIVPVGVDLCFSVVVRDRNGRAFTVLPNGGDALRVQSSNQGVVSVQTQAPSSASVDWSAECHVRVRTETAGRAVLRANWVGTQPSAVDYVHVTVGESETGLPTTLVLYPGSSLCLPLPKNKFHTYERERPYYLEEQPACPDGKKKYRATKKGKTSLALKSGRDVLSKVTVHVADVTTAQVSKTFNGNEITNSPGASYDFAVTFESEAGPFSPVIGCDTTQPSTHGYTSNVPYTCVFALAHLYSGSPYIDHATGATYCRATAIELPPQTAGQPQFGIAVEPLLLTVRTVGSKMPQISPVEVIKKKVVALTVPALAAQVVYSKVAYAMEAGQVFGNLTLTNAQFHEGVEPIAADPSVLQIVPAPVTMATSRVGTQSDTPSTARVYNLIAVQGAFNATTVVFESPRTAQELKVVLNAEDADSDSSVYAGDVHTPTSDCQGTGPHLSAPGIKQGGTRTNHSSNNNSGATSMVFMLVFMVGVAMMILFVVWNYLHGMNAANGMRMTPHVPRNAGSVQNPFNQPL
ncbi:hypothetical protein SARC_08323 [Sphaeroforma arctica JP610]|uniref:BIG2 domain-containing protein n=1 Tax=Sphaeroforma arctica JP610 TaxID=667725 RepID=A0A0L0FR84_9EUKA|nr:hypothetical protein SARC_08323 [Sphaeroforma arctica JP610]KNC79280.1 hypothetical protein SARC_08323 [Sphaeroforma arctica JP610]|eukprot:XP_014153182.1 hypothetical protein SARC_08323 [Sphaeroforma arctica JP610]